MRKRIAIVGTGISGLGAAWALHRDHDIVVYESDGRIGGHSNTVFVTTADGTIPVDTGFIVYNEVTYPNLTRLFAALAVPTEPSDMSFAYSRDGIFEYGASLRGILAQPSNILRSRYRAMLRDIDRFRRIGGSLDPAVDESIGDLLIRYGFSEGFAYDYLFPMASAIWSARTTDIRRFPARSILRFLSNHGLIEIVGRPRWRTVSGGSRSYLLRLTADFAEAIRLNAPVTRVERLGPGVVVETPTGTDLYDEVILATHADQSLDILGEAVTAEERYLLGAMVYQPNVAVLHSDTTLMPRRRATWSSWNAMASTNGGPVASVTYWMNRLQNLATSVPLLVSLNPIRPPDPNLVHGRFNYAHPQFDAATVRAQPRLAAIQGDGGVWFAGAYMGYGFHEDGLQAGLNVAAALGSPAPWHGTFQPMSSAPAVGTRLSIS